jgi:hypothetical protein
MEANPGCEGRGGATGPRGAGTEGGEAAGTSYRQSRSFQVKMFSLIILVAYPQINWKQFNMLHINRTFLKSSYLKINIQKAAILTLKNLS